MQEQTAVFKLIRDRTMLDENIINKVMFSSVFTHMFAVAFLQPGFYDLIETYISNYSSRTGLHASQETRQVVTISC